MRRPTGSLIASVAFLAILLLAPFAASLPPGGTPARGAAPLESDLAGLPIGVASTPLPADFPLHLTVTLAPRSSNGLERLDAALGDPASPQYRHFLTEDQYLAQFAPAPASVAAVSDYFSTHGATAIALTPDRSALLVSIDAGPAARALGTTFVGWAGAGGRTLFTGVAAPQLPSSLAPLVLGLDGLSGTVGARAAMHALPVAEGRFARSHGPPTFVNDSSSGASWYYGSDLTQVYDLTGLFPPSGHANATYGSGEAVATILMSGYNGTLQTDLPPFDPVVVDRYFNDTFPSTWPHPNVRGVPVNVSGVTPPLPGGNGGLSDTSGDQPETSLDLEMAGSMAPAASLTTFYFAASLVDGPASTLSNAGLADDFAQCLSAALAFDYGSSRLAAVTNSYGLPDVNSTLWNTELAHAQAIGVSVLSASGDQGNAPPGLTNAYQGQWPSWPASAAFDAYGTVAVGGTSLVLGGRAQGNYSGSFLPKGYDSNLSGAVATSAWYDTNGGAGNFTGSEGGVSALYAEPSWQFHSAAQPPISAATGDQGIGQLGRSEPDVAFDANTTIAYVRADTQYVYFEVLEGTSIASPLFAGMIAEWSAVAGHPFGYLDPELYRIASYFAAYPGPSDPFVDVTTGANYVFAARPGWDAVTGWGSLNATAFLSADANASVSGYVYDGPTPGVPSPGRPAPATSLDTVLLVAIGIVVALLVVVVFTFGRTPVAPPSAPMPPGSFAPPAPLAAPPPWDSVGPPPPPTGPPPPPATFACPYCGTTRPAEPVRCPGCGAW